jgi:hypothetical protein
MIWKFSDEEGSKCAGRNVVTYKTTFRHAINQFIRYNLHTKATKKITYNTLQFKLNHPFLRYYCLSPCHKC